MYEQEEWRTVVGFPEYEVSDHGRVMSHMRGRPRLLSGWRHSHGYRAVNLGKGGGAPKFVHALVAEAFIGPRPEGMEVRHLNGDPFDNRLSNIRWGTHAENMQDILRHGNNNNANKTSCPQGHPYDESNTYIQPTGGRRCRVCHRASRNAAKARRTLRAASVPTERAA